MQDRPLILWFRRDLRLADQPMLAAAVATGRPLVPLFLLDPETEALGAAPKWRLGLAVAAFAARLAGLGAPMVLRRGPALEVLRALVAETGAGGVWWSRLYDPASVARDTAVKAALRAEGLEARSFAGHLLHEPWEVQTGQGGPYRVYTPFWNAVRGREVEAPTPAPRALRGVPGIGGDRLEDWHLGAAMRRGAGVVLPHQTVGEAAATDRLAAFLAGPVARYGARRDFPAETATSGLSENLTYGEIGVRTVWHAGMRARDEGAPGAETFLKEVVWREFSHHLLHHFPAMERESWRPGWEDFPWRGDNPEAERWRRGMTGEPLVDAGMREMYVTGQLPDQASSDALAGGAGLVRRLPDRLGPGRKCHGLAMGCWLRTGCRTLFPGVQSGRPGREVRPRPCLSPPLAGRTVARAGAGCTGLFRCGAAGLGAAARCALSGAGGGSCKGPGQGAGGLWGTKCLSRRQKSGTMAQSWPVHRCRGVGR